MLLYMARAETQKISPVHPPPVLSVLDVIHRPNTVRSSAYNIWIRFILQYCFYLINLLVTHLATISICVICTLYIKLFVTLSMSCSNVLKIYTCCWSSISNLRTPQSLQVLKLNN